MDHQELQQGTTEQEEIIARMEVLASEEREKLSEEEREAVLNEILALSETLSEDDQETTRCVQHLFIRFLRASPTILENDTFRHFIADCLDSRAYRNIEWESAEDVIALTEVLYGFRFHDRLSASEVTNVVQDLMSHALRQFERKHLHEEMFRLLQRSPVLGGMLDSELIRLRNRAHLYEMRRIERNRRFLYGFLFVQVVLVLVVFPMLFLHFENGVIRREIEQLTEIELPREPEQYFSYYDALYWSIITAASVGYGDIIPKSRGAKILAMIAGTLGVLTVGVVAGLILNWITPRELR